MPARIRTKCTPPGVGGRTGWSRTRIPRRWWRGCSPQRLAGHSAARITRALNDAGIPCPSAADPKRNPHRTGTAWTLRTVAAILANPRYTGRQVWNRQRTDFDLVDPANTGLGHRQVQRWNLPAGWVISRRPAHPALVSEADFIAAQDATAPRGPAGPATRRYLLAGLLACGRCGRRLESAWSNGKPAYRCRHGYTSATGPRPGRPKNLTCARTRSCRTWPPSPSSTPATVVPGGTRPVQVTAPAQTADLIDRLRAADVTLIYDPDTRTIHSGDSVAVIAGRDRWRPPGTLARKKEAEQRRAAPACGAAGALDAAVGEPVVQGGRGRESLVVRDAVQRFRRGGLSVG